MKAVIFKGITLAVAHFRDSIHELISYFRVIVLLIRYLAYSFKQFFWGGGVPTCRFVRVKPVCFVIMSMSHVFFRGAQEGPPISLFFFSGFQDE